MSWICASCGAESRDEDSRCTKCGSRGTQTRRPTAPILTADSSEPSEPPTEPKPQGGMITGSGAIPAYLPDCRFVTNKAWTSGALYAVEEGFFLLSAEDGMASIDKAASRKVPPGDEVRVSSKSQWIPVKAIKRVAHSHVTGHKIELLKDGPVPIRFDSAGWAALQTVCTQLHVEYVW